MGKSTISMAIFNSYVKLPEGTQQFFWGELQETWGFLGVLGDFTTGNGIIIGYTMGYPVMTNSLLMAQLGVNIPYMEHMVWDIWMYNSCVSCLNLLQLCFCSRGERRNLRPLRDEDLSSALQKRAAPWWSSSLSRWSELSLSPFFVNREQRGFSWMSLEPHVPKSALWFGYEYGMWLINLDDLLGKIELMIIM